MASLIAMCCYDTLENKRSDYTRRTLESLIDTVDFKKHRLGIFDNGSCKETQEIINEYAMKIGFHYGESRVISKRIEKNKGTAWGINRIWSLKNENENCCKCDNDVVIDNPGWLDKIEMVFKKDATIGICALKRMDLEEHPDSEHPFYKSTIKMLPHEKGEPYLTVEFVEHAFGTCQVYSSEFLKHFGYMYQFSEYSLDDSIASHRCKVLGYKSAFLPHVDIHHIDSGGDDYTIWKQKHAGEMMQNYYSQYIEGLYNGDISPYYDGGLNL